MTKNKAGVQTSAKAMALSILQISEQFLSKADETGVTCGEINSRLESVRAIHDKFLQALFSEPSNEEQYAELEVFESRYHLVIGGLSDLLTKFQTSEVNSLGTTSRSNIILPKISLPVFTGKISEWMSFRDIIKHSIVDDKSIPNSNKLIYLKSSLRGSPLDSISHLSNIDTNFDIAWGVLLSNYDNPRLISDQLVKGILNLASIKAQNAHQLQTFTNEAFKMIRSLDVIHKNIESSNFLLIPLIVSKLDQHTQCLWEETQTRTTFPTLKNLEEFLHHRIDVLSVVNDNKKSNSLNYKPAEPSSRVHHVAIGSAGSSQSSCPLCKLNHHIFHCKQFLALKPSDRRSEVRSCKLCFNCLKQGHSVTSCKSSSVCSICKLKHNSLLHFEEPPSQSAPTSFVCVSSGQQSPQNVLLATVVVKVVGPKGNSIEVRALLDSGATNNIISSRIMSQLKLPKEQVNILVKGVSAKPSSIKYTVQVELQSLVSQHKYHVSCLVMDRLTDVVPSSSIDPKSIRIPTGFRLADPEFFKASTIDLILGSEIFFHVLHSERLELDDSLFLSNTSFGWVLAGKVPGSNSEIVCCHANTAMSYTQTSSESSLNKQLERFWELDSQEVIVPPAQDVQKAEEHYSRTTTLNHDGRYIVRLPFADSPSKLGKSHELATQRFFHLERRLAKNTSIKQQYLQFMQEYIDCNHMRLVSNEELNVLVTQSHYFIPHHPVIKSSSITTRLRVVFDASMQTSSGVSLNKILSPGPVLQSNIFNILLRFRSYLYGMIADIEKMYRQIRVHPEDTNFQLILWRENPSQPLSTYRLLTVTYGLTSAPYLAQRTLKQLALDNQQSHPLAAHAVLHEFYVDDLLSGSNSEEGLHDLYNDLNTLFLKGNMNLRKWYTNSTTFVKSIASDSSSEVYLIPLSEGDSVSTLGVKWIPSLDKFCFQVQFSATKALTKRVILSEISKIFDPMGFLGPLTTKCKLFMRLLWSTNLQWDEDLSEELKNKWKSLQDHLSSVSNISIPRTFILHNTIALELHGFSDASESAFGSVLYIKAVDSVGTIKVTLIASRSRIAPTKPQTIPRLELCGILVLSQLWEQVHKSLSHLNFTSINFWSDSMIALHWVHSEPCKFQTFVSNRIQRIQELTDGIKWYHISSELNPADELSRGSLKPRSSWWHGPDFLHEPNIVFNSFQPTSTLELPEGKRVGLVHILSEVTDVVTNLRFTQCSSWTKLIRVMAYVQRFINGCKKKQRSLTLDISQEEYNGAQVIILKVTQQSTFPEEYNYLKAGKTLPRSIKTLTLSPFLDDVGLLRVGGRLRHSELKDETKHPVLLPSSNHITKLILQYFHRKHLHCGPQLLLSLVRQSFWPINGLLKCKSVVRGCVTCFKAEPKPFSYLMGQLPHDRVTVHPPFSNSGLDFAGPFSIKRSNLRNSALIKVFICIFVCMSSKACHIEVVSDLTSEAFIAALRRFVARRGYPSHLYCDNGRNFVGANNQLKSFYKWVSSKENIACLNKEFMAQCIQFHFIPARSPSFGGLWEAAVKSCKRLLLRNASSVSLEYEQFLTLINQIEALLNSRPLTVLNADPDSLEALTPGHLLIGRPLVAVPERPNTNVMPRHLPRWDKVQQIHQTIWNRWVREYLTTLQTKAKWCHFTGTKPSVGDLVVLKEDSLPPSTWRLGRIVDLHTGIDGITRAATVRTTTGHTRRGIRTLCPLPLNQNST